MEKRDLKKLNLKRITCRACGKTITAGLRPLYANKALQQKHIVLCVACAAKKEIPLT